MTQAADVIAAWLADQPRTQAWRIARETGLTVEEVESSTKGNPRFLVEPCGCFPKGGDQGDYISLRLVVVSGRPGPDWPENVVGMVSTPATREGGYPFHGKPVPLYRLPTDTAERIGAEGMLYACRTPEALGLPENWPTVRLPDYHGGWFQAALFEAPGL